jgi:hypothetical protein
MQSNSDSIHRAEIGDFLHIDFNAAQNTAHW